MKKAMLIILTVTIAASMSVFGFACTAEPATETTAAPETTATETTAAPETTAAETTMAEETTAVPEEDDSIYVAPSVDDGMWKNISNFLTQSYLADDLEFMSQEDKKFQFYAIDLNLDGQDEYFVYLISPYFCGTGGCTILLLDRYSEIITEFTVMEPPLYVSMEQTNGWRDLLIYSEGSYRDLIFDGTTYPDNPSVAPESSTKEPDEDDTYTWLFDDEYFPCKTYYFYEPEDM